MKCKARRERGDSAVVATSVDAEHAHLATIDIKGDGVTNESLSARGVPHVHVVRDFVALESAGHTHTVADPVGN